MSLKAQLRQTADAANADSARKKAEDQEAHERAMVEAAASIIELLLKDAQNAAASGRYAVMTEVPYDTWSDGNFREACKSHAKDVTVSFESDGYMAHHVMLSWK